MRPVGFVTDGAGRRVFALVPVAQLGSPAIRRKLSVGSATDEELVVLSRLLTTPVACVETSSQANPIRAARETAGITQADLAFAMGISQPMLSRQEQPFRRLQTGTVKRVLDTIRRIQENRNRPTVSFDEVLSEYGARVAASAVRKPRDPIERRLLQEAGDPVAQLEPAENLREGGERRRPPRRTPR
jgi:transcriptional regulator with XRE-family HTH domain